MKLHIELTNEDNGYVFSYFDEDIEEDLTMGEIYRMAQREYGRCRSKVYVDDGVPVGWFFESSQQYDHSNERYLRGAWVMVAKS